MLIGNDLVDLRAREARGKASDRRFIRRVFTEGEAAWIRGSAEPDRALWMLWAGKEAAYKIARKLRCGIPFVHRAYEVVLGATTDAPAAGAASIEDGQPGAPGISGELPGAGSRVRRLLGSVRLLGVKGLSGACFPVEWEVAAAYVHCVATEAGSGGARVWSAVALHDGRDARVGSAPAAHSPGATRSRSRSLLGAALLRGLHSLPLNAAPAECAASADAEDGMACGAHERPEVAFRAYEPSERELASVRSAQSLAVRRLAWELAREAGLGAVEIVREAAGRVFGPPRLFSAGAAKALDGWDVSLSHDGGLAAAVLAGAAAERS